MSENSQAAVAEPPAEVRAEHKPADKKPKPLPPYGVFVLNDDLHSFSYVIETFQKVFRYDAQKAFELARHIHLNGRGLVFSGSKEVAELKRDQIRGAGPDFHAAQKVEFPLGAYIEPLE